MTANSPSPQAVSLREAVHDWIREDAPTGLKMLLTPELANKLIGRIASRASPADGVVVPLTDAMIKAADAYIRSIALDGQYVLPAMFRWHDMWSAMLAASPTLAATSGGGEGWRLSGNPFGTGLSEPRLVRAQPAPDGGGEGVAWIRPEDLKGFLYGIEHGRSAYTTIYSEAVPRGCAEEARLPVFFSPPSPDADKLLIAREALEATKDRVLTWPIEDHETCMCGSPVEGHNIGSGRPPVSQGDHAISMIVEAINKALARLSTTEAGG